MRKLLLLISVLIPFLVNAQGKTGLWDENSPKLTELNNDSLSISEIHKEVLKRRKIAPTIKENTTMYYVFNTVFDNKGVLLNATVANEVGYYALSDVLYFNTKNMPAPVINVRFSEYPFSYLRFTKDSIPDVSLMLPEKYKNWFDAVSKPQYINDSVHDKKYIYK